MKKQDFKVLKTKDLYPFPDNPFYSIRLDTATKTSFQPNIPVFLYQNTRHLLINQQ